MTLRPADSRSETTRSTSQPTRNRQVDVAAIRRDHPIEDVVRAAGIELRPAGHGFVGRCPFHDDTTPSMSVAGVTDRFTCFGCGAHGDVIDFVQRLHGLTFIETAHRLTFEPPTRALDPRPGTPFAPAGPAVPANGESASFTVGTERGFEVNAQAWQHLSSPVRTGFADHYLLHHRGIDVLPLRGQQADVAVVGYAGHGWTSLGDALRRRGVTPQELVEMDLAQPTRDGRLIDTLRDRIIVPVTDAERRVRGFIGRDITGDPRAPKYRNPTRTPTFVKPRILYRPTQHHLDLSGTVVVVEGALDALAIAAAAAAAGRTAEFAPCTASGVTVSPHQAGQVLGLAREASCVIALDGDQAGADGTSRWLLELTVLHHKLAYVTHVPDGRDPADWIRLHGPAGLDAFQAVPVARAGGGITPTLPGQELALLAMTGRGDPVANACQHLIPLLRQLPPPAAWQLLEQAEREATRHGWNGHGDFTAALRRHPETQAAYASPAPPLQQPGPDLGIDLA